MPEAPMRNSRTGLVVDGDGWFVVNAQESRWRDEGPLGAYCTFEGKKRFPHFGINVTVLEPGERFGMYHREKAQEAFLVLAGECTLIVEGRERRLVAWDFFYCAPETEHIIVAVAIRQVSTRLAAGRLTCAAWMRQCRWRWRAGALRLRPCQDDSTATGIPVASRGSSTRSRSCYLRSS